MIVNKFHSRAVSYVLLTALSLIGLIVQRDAGLSHTLRKQIGDG